jgi:hypothetical protein
VRVDRIEAERASSGSFGSSGAQDAPDSLRMTVCWFVEQEQQQMQKRIPYGNDKQGTTTATASANADSLRE